jgi:hypothetical protein
LEILGSVIGNQIRQIILEANHLSEYWIAIAGNNSTLVPHCHWQIAGHETCHTPEPTG